MPSISALFHLPTSLAYVILNIDPVLLRIGALAVRWYGLMYVVAISIGLAVVLRWARHMGLHEDQVWSIFIWAAIGGLVGGRLYFVIQQPDLVKNYLMNPINIIAVWNGGMAFFGAIFLGSAALFYFAPRYGIDRWLILDGGALFAAVGQIFGRFGNIINGDILGYQAGPPVTPPQGICLNAPCITYVNDPHVLSWAFVYLNPASFAPQGIPFQPAPVYEMLLNLVALAILWPLRLVLPRVKTGVLLRALSGALLPQPVHRLLLPRQRANHALPGHQCAEAGAVDRHLHLRPGGRGLLPRAALRHRLAVHRAQPGAVPAARGRPGQGAGRRARAGDRAGRRKSRAGGAHHPSPSRRAGGPAAMDPRRLTLWRAAQHFRRRAASRAEGHASRERAGGIRE